MGRASSRKKQRRINRKKIAAMAVVAPRRKVKKSQRTVKLNPWPQSERERTRRLRRLHVSGA